MHARAQHSGTSIRIGIDAAQAHSDRRVSSRQSTRGSTGISIHGCREFSQQFGLVR